MDQDLHWFNFHYNTKFEAASRPYCRLMHHDSKTVEERVRETVNQMQDFWLREAGG